MGETRGEPAGGGPGVTRRGAIRALAAGWGAAVASRAFARDDDAGRGTPPGRRLIVRNTRPLDAETPVEAFERWLTPNEVFFVRSHFGAPAVGLGPWSLRVGGMVREALDLSPDDLDVFEAVTLPAVLQCAGNGRALFAPKVAGVGWERGAVGNAEWSGVRLRDVLERAGLADGARHVHLLGADAPPNPRTPAFFRSLPLEKALDPATLVATRMNGEPLPTLHGGPLRLVVPGWTGNHWLKWLRSITASADEAPGFYQQTGYRMPRSPAPPGASVPPGDLVPVAAMNVKSLIARPSRGARLEPGPVEVRGVAWTGIGHVERVEISVDGEGWRPARLEGPDHEYAWRLWTFSWEARPGRHTIRVRAADSSGQTQPESSPWNRSGYLWNGIDAVECEVG